MTQTRLPSPQTPSTFSPRLLQLFGLCLGIGWAVFVVISYFGVDNGFVFDLIRTPVNKILVKAVLAGILLFGAARFYGTRPGRPTAGILLLGPLVSHPSVPLH